MSETDFLLSDSLPARPRPPRSEELNCRTIKREEISVPIGPVDWKELPLTEIAKLLPNFEVLAFLGRGGMGAVYKARQLCLDRLVAIKLLPMEVAEDSNFATRFVREAKTMARLNHPRIVAVHDYGTTPQRHSYFVMEYVDGATLHDLNGAQSLSAPEALQVIRDVCEGLAYAHAEGVVHRDIKPANVLINRLGRAKVADFGIARLNLPEFHGQTTGILFGTPDYMAPEQRDRGDVDHRADIFALGVMLYEALCHRLPRGNVDPPSKFPGVDPRFDQIVAKAMHHEPDKRYQNAKEFLRDLKQFPVPSDSLAPGAVAPPSIASAPVSLAPAAFTTRSTRRRQLIQRWALAIVVVLGSAAAIEALVTREARKKETKPLPAPPPSRHEAFIAPVAPPKPAPSTSPIVVTPPKTKPAPEQWRDWIAEELQRRGELPDGLIQVTNGVAARAPAGKPGSYIICPPEMENQALRVTYRPTADGSDAGMQLILRSSIDFKSLYRAHAYPAEWQILRRDPNERFETLSTIRKTDEMKRPGPRTVELRAVGDTLTLFFNGNLIATAHDPHFRKGRARIHCGDGIIFEKIEYLDLGKITAGY